MHCRVASGEIPVAEGWSVGFRNLENAKTEEGPRYVGSEPAAFRLNVPIMEERSSPSDWSKLASQEALESNDLADLDSRSCVSKMSTRCSSFSK